MQRCAIVVDDNEGVLFLHELMIRESGLAEHIRLFKDAEAALEYLGQAASGDLFHLIFLDINMPRVNGWDFLQKLQQQAAWSSMPVVMVTSSIQASDHQDATNYAQVIDFVEKPLTLEYCMTLKSLESLQPRPIN